MAGVDYGAIIDQMDSDAGKSAAQQPDYGAVIDEVDSQDTTARRAAVAQALKTNPDQYAKAKQLGAKTGIPTEVVERNLDEVNLRATLDEVDALAKKAPTIGAQLRNPDVAKLVMDDLPSWEEAHRVLTTEGFAAASKASKQRSKDLGNYMQRVAKPSGRARSFDDVAANMGLSFLAGLGPRVSQGAYGVAAVPFDVLSTLIGKPLAGRVLPEDVFGKVAEGLRAVSQNQRQLGDRVQGDQTEAGFVERSVSSGMQSFGQNIPALIAAMYTNNPELALGSLSALTGGTEYVKAIEAGLPVEQAVVYATSQAAVEYATEKIPVSTLLKNVKEGTGFFKTMFVNQVQEQFGEQVATVLQDLNEWAALNPDKPFSAYLGERPSAAAQTAIATLIATSGQVTLTKGVEAITGVMASRTSKAELAQANAERLAELSAITAASKVFARDPSTFENFVQATAEESGATPSEVFLDVRVLQQAGVDLEALAMASPTVAAQLQEAVATGSDIVVPIGEYTTRIAANEQFGQAVLPHVRFAEDGMTQLESQTFYQQQQQEFQAEATKLAEERSADEVWNASAQAVEDNILQQLQSAGRFTESANKAYATLVRSFYSVTSAKLGITPEQMFERYPLQVKSQMTIGENTLTQVDTTQVDSPAFRTWFGNSKIVDSQGKPEVWYHGTQQDFESFDPGWRGLIFVARDPDFAQNFAEMVPDSPGSTMPLFVKAENPFDATNPEHIAALRARLREQQRFNELNEVDDLEQNAGTGRSTWAYLESEKILQAIKDLGHDGFFATEQGSDTLAVFDPTQVKSAVGNNGNFNPSNPSILQQSATLREGKETLQKYGLDPRKKYTVREVAAALEARQREKYGVISMSDKSDEAAKKIAKWMVAEVEFEMQHPEKSGLGWYSEKWQRAMDTFATEFPELKTDQNARDIMTVLVALTSDGQAVMGNFAQAVELYAPYREKGRFESDRKHNRQGSVEKNLARVQQLLDTKGPEALRGYLLEEDTVSNLAKQARAEGLDFNVGYQATTKLPRAAVILGPKLGVFYANLMGTHGYLTMDRWWMRTFNRYRGGLLPKPTAAGLARFRQLIGKPELSDEETVAAAVAPAANYKKRKFKNGSEIEKAANTIIRAAQEELLDTPLTATDRTFMIKTAQEARKALKRKSIDMSIADLQATLWYYEKRLYGDLGARQSMDVSYEEAAQRVIADRRGEQFQAAQQELDLGAEPYAYARSTGTVLFEVAPDPDNVELAERWNALGFQQQAAISQSVAELIAPQILQFAKTSGRMDAIIGGYEGSTSPAFALRVDDVDKAVEVAKALGTVLAQKGMAVMSHKAAKGTQRGGALTLDLPEHFGLQEIDALYQKLWELERDGVKLVTGHTTANGQMLLLAPEGFKLQEFAELVDQHLGGAYDIHMDTVYTAFPSNGEDYNYGNIRQAKRGATRRPPAEVGELTRIQQQVRGAIDQASRGSTFQQSGNGGGGLALRSTAPLAGAPIIEGATGPDPRLVAVAERYAASVGINLKRQAEYVAIDPERAARLAAAYDAMPHAPQDPAVKEAYDNLIQQTVAQYRALEAAGYRFYFYDSTNDPYDGNPWNAMRELRSSQTMGVYATEDGFGSGATDIDVADNPLLADTGIVWPFGSLDGEPRRVLANDLFRAVHDAFGHGLEGAGFRAQGEENAWQAHARLFTGSALAALTSETRGQNSWLNFGPYGEKNRTAVVTETMFADQKTGLLPEWAWTEGVVADMPDTPNTLAQPDQEGARGQIAFADDITKTPSVITLLENADLSTFLHESGHFFLEVLADIAGRQDAPAEVQADMAIVLGWFGVENVAQWQALDLESKRPYHEQFARGFEAYLFEGNAPASPLLGVFQKFRAWLVHVYKALQGLNVTLTDEVRGVFDRLIATNEQIKQMEAERAMAPLFKNAEQAGMTAEEWADYQRTGLAATVSAVEQLESRSLRDMRWLTNAKSRVLKALQRDAASTRKAVRAEVEAEVKQQPVYAAMEFLKYGKLQGEPVTGGFKLSIPEIDELYKDNPAVGAIKNALGYGKYGMLGVDNGIHPQQVAEAFGFTSPDHLIRELINAEPIESVIEGMTDQRMLENFGDLTDERAMSAAADAAVHNEARARFVATEMRALNNAYGPARTILAAAKEAARRVISGKRIRDIKPGVYTAAEARAARLAEKSLAADDIQATAVAKRDQLLNNQLARTAFDAQEEVAKGVRYLGKFTDTGTRKTIDPDYIDQIDSLLERYDLRTGQSLRAIDKRASLAEWIKKQQDLGFEPVIDDALLNEAMRTSYKNLTVEEFRGLVDAVRNIEHLGRLKHKLLTLQDQRAFAEIVADVGASIEANAKKTLPTKLEQNSLMDSARKLGNQFLASHRKLASIVRQMDGFKDGGKLWDVLVRGMNAAGDREATMREQATIALSDIFQPLTKAGGLAKKLYIPAIGTSLSLEGRLMVALNWGNEGNRQRLMDGDNWTQPQVEAIIDTLTKEQMDFVQSVWNFLRDTYQEDIGAQQKRLTGVEPEWVQPSQVVTRHGVYEGGYFPAKYDTDRSTRALSDEAATDVANLWRAKRGAAKTRDGFTKNRAEAVVGRPLRKDFGVLFQHVTEVTHRLAWQDWLIDSQRLLRAKPIDNAIRLHYGPEMLQALRLTMEDIAAGEVPAQNAFETSINWLRTGATIAGLGWNLSTSLLQPLGLTQSIVRVGPTWVARGVARWLGDAARMESTTAWIYANSEFMRLRGKTFQREVAEIRNKIRKGGALTAIEDSYFLLIQKGQLVADVPTWLGAYEKAMASGVDEAKAFALADQAVLDSQGGGMVKDLAQVQRGGPLMKLWTNFYSYFSVTYNLAVESTQKATLRDPLSVGKAAVDLVMLTVVPATLGALLKAALKGEDDEDELKERLIRENLNYTFGMMVGLRDAASFVNGYAGYTGPAGQRFFAEFSNLGKQVEQGEADAAFFRSLNNVGGIVFHYPAGQVQRTTMGFSALASGESNNPGVLVVGPPRQ